MRARSRRRNSAWASTGLLRARADRVSGILNGVDEETWDPATDAHLGTRYDHWSLPSRARNKAALQKRLRLRVDPDAFLIGVVSRLSWQKGLDLLLDVLPQLMRGAARNSRCSALAIRRLKKDLSLQRRRIRATSAFISAIAKNSRI